MFSTQSKIKREKKNIFKNTQYTLFKTNLNQIFIIIHTGMNFTTSFLFTFYNN